MSAALAALGHDVDVVTTQLAHRGSWIKWPSAEDLIPMGVDRTVEQDGYRLVFCRPSWPTRWGTSLEMLMVLRRVIPAATIVHIHSLYLFHTLVASRLARRSRVPYVIRPHGTLDPYIRRRHRLLKKVYHGVIEDSTLRHAGAIHFTTPEERDLASPVLPPGVETCVVPHGIDLKEFESLPTRTEARETLGMRDEQTIWLFLGRLNHKKGLDLLAPAFAELSKRVHNSFLIVAGPDDDGLMPRFIEECRRGGVGDSVRCTGFLDRAQMKQVLAAADFWILPSYSENFGVAVVEAMAARLPVLVTDRVNIWRHIQASRAGVVTRAETASVLDGMHRLAQLSHRERAEMGRRGRELCRRSFSWEKTAQDLTALYTRMVR